MNDYLASRDAEWMGRGYRFLGLTVGVNLSQMDAGEAGRLRRRHHLRHQQRIRLRLPARQHGLFTGERVQRGLAYAIVDEVDSILIDEARTPLIISGQADDHTELYVRMNLARRRCWATAGRKGPRRLLGRRKAHQVLLSRKATSTPKPSWRRAGHAGPGSGLYDRQHPADAPPLRGAARPPCSRTSITWCRTARSSSSTSSPALMAGRRWSTACTRRSRRRKGVAIQNENQTLASITFQNYFRMYGKLSGMTGTADTEAYEFQQIYGWKRWSSRPTSRCRKDMNDQIYRTAEEKTRRSLPISATVTSAGSRCWSAPPRSRIRELLSGPARQGKSCRTRC